MVEPDPGQPGFHRRDDDAVRFGNPLQSTPVGINGRFRLARGTVELRLDVMRHRAERVPVTRLLHGPEHFLARRFDRAARPRPLEGDQTGQGLGAACFLVLLHGAARRGLRRIEIPQLEMREGKLVVQPAQSGIPGARLLEVAQRLAETPGETRSQRRFDKIPRHPPFLRRRRGFRQDHRLLGRFSRHNMPREESGNRQQQDHHPVEHRAQNLQPHGFMQGAVGRHVKSTRTLWD